MGCLFSRTSSKSSLTSSRETTNVYSWDSKQRLDPKDYTIENIKNQCLIRKPYTVNGQQFIIQNCEDSTLLVLDYINTATIDDCINCNIFLGPTKGSVFVRSCEGCRIMTACQQFRARDCLNVDLYLCVPTQPIIESCTRMQFGCFTYYYDELKEQFNSANLSMFNNQWNKVYDFTPIPNEKNWTLLSKDVSLKCFLPKCEEEGLRISVDTAHSIVPWPLSFSSRHNQKKSLVLIFADGHSQQRALNFIKEMSVHNETEQNTLVSTLEVKLDSLDAQRLLHTNVYNAACNKGPVIALLYSGGERCPLTCKEVARALDPKLICICSDPKTTDSFLHWAKQHANNS